VLAPNNAAAASATPTPLRTWCVAEDVIDIRVEEST
jgi:hypothetical protein